MKNKNSIAQLKEALSQAIRNKDAAKANSLYANNCILFLLAPPLQEKLERGIDTINDLDNWLATFKDHIGLESKEITIVQDNNLACVHSLEHLIGHRTDGSLTDTWYRETLCFSKTDSGWKIIHQHQSFPMLMDGSNRAATELKP